MMNRRTLLSWAGASILSRAFCSDGAQFRQRPVRRGDGKGGWVTHPSEIQFLHRKDGTGIKPFGISQMDNGEVILVASWDDGSAAKSAKDREKPVVAFTRDGGGTWTDFQLVEGARGRPVMLTDLGKGKLFFQTDLTNPIQQHFSADYGRTWPERRVLQPPLIEGSFGGVEGFYGGEGNPLVDGVKRVGAIGFTYKRGTTFPADPAVGMLRWSTDGGRSWSKEITPPVWLWKDEFQGKTYMRGISEGSLVRAANGWIVAALRTDMPYRFNTLHNDNLEGIAVSISKDDGATFSPLHGLYQGGRMHANLLRLPNGHLVMTYIVRQDYEGITRVSYRRGCEALISRDNGQTWDMRGKYILDEFEYSDGTPLSTACGHLSSTLLDDGRILTTYGNYLAKAAVVIRWKPAA